VSSRPGHTDEGLQPERTLLAWGRTLLAMLVASLFFLRWMPHHGGFAGGLIGSTLLVALLIWVSQQQRYRHRVEGINAARFPADVRGVMGLGAMVTLIGAAAIWITLAA
jgi:multisubunit Na+/H+ antiporter MnhB subunit